MVQPPHGGSPAPVQGSSPTQPGQPDASSDVPASVEAAPKSRRGCAAIVLISAVTVILLLGGTGIGVYVWLSGPGGRYEAAPGCVQAEGDSLAQLVNDPDLDLDGPIDTRGQAWWDGNQCRWTTTETSAGMPASASVSFIRSGNRMGIGGETAAKDDLERAPGGIVYTDLDDLGDEAIRWYDDRSRHGCAASRISNLVVTACYEASKDFAASKDIGQDEAIKGAVNLAREIVTSVQ
ncbi:hypothetical protein [Nocardiopsis ansamitocini]|uniref:Uncharacterized protein n=1 Tax=Nocardiopsis ansamitocini TaxID=1670832 RepID=A0A9W6P6N9_9ACTN|nr:hypothetical protein [Nocardiopsis ansamitocini]GLU48022.1 hypothetical protein Nans01_23730 [Nocardiopsis ansamitocini]